VELEHRRCRNEAKAAARPAPGGATATDERPYSAPLTTTTPRPRAAIGTQERSNLGTRSKRADGPDRPLRTQSVVCATAAAPTAAGLPIAQPGWLGRNRQPARGDRGRTHGGHSHHLDGHPRRTVNAADVLLVPAETVHAVRNAGRGKAAELATSVVEKASRSWSSSTEPGECATRKASRYGPWHPTASPSGAKVSRTALIALAAAQVEQEQDASRRLRRGRQRRYAGGGPEPDAHRALKRRTRATDRCCASSEAVAVRVPPALLPLPRSRSPRPLCPDCGFSRKAESRRHDARPRQSSRMTCMVTSPARSTST
jgi:hypothetical protein